MCPRLDLAVLLAVALAPQLARARPGEAAATTSSPADRRPATAATVAASAAPEPVPADAARGWAQEPGPSALDAVLAGPRLVLAVPRLALELTFVPVRAGLRFMERHRLVEHTVDLLYNDARTAAVLPVVSYQSDFGMSYGASAFHENLLGHGERLSAGASYGGRYLQAYDLGLEGERLFGSRMWLELRLRYEANPGLLFNGYGMRDLGEVPASPRSPRDVAVETRYRQERLHGIARAGTTLGSRPMRVHVGAALVANHRTFGREDVSGGRSLEDVYDTSRVAGYDEGTSTLELLGSVRVDTRDRDGLGAAGLYLDAFAGGAPRAHGYGYGHTGVELSWTIDLYRHDRLLTLRAATESVLAPMAEVPFGELPTLGGAYRLRGYSEDRFRDRHAALASVAYLYPVHANVLAELYADAGRVGSRWRDLEEVSSWRAGYGAGLLVGNADAITLRLDVSYGEGWRVFAATDLAAAFHDGSVLR